MIGSVLSVWQKLFLPRPDPSRPQLTIRLSATRHGLDHSGTYSNSQFFVSIFNLTKRLALHFVMVKGA